MGTYEHFLSKMKPHKIKAMWKNRAHSCSVY